MTSILSVDAAGKLKIDHGGKSYLFDGANGHLLDGTTKVKPEAAEDVFKAVVTEIEAKGGKLSGDVKKKLAEDIIHFPTTAIADDAAKTMQKALKGAEAIAASPKDHTLIGKTLVASPDAEKFLSVAENKAVLAEGFDFGKLESFRKAKSSLATLVASPSVTKDQIEALLINHHGAVDHLEIPADAQIALAKKSVTFDLTAMRKEIATKVSEGVVKAENHAKDIVRVTEELAKEGAKVKPDASTVNRLTKELADHTKDFKEVTGGKFGGKVAETFKANHATLAEDLAKAQKDVGSHLDSAAKSVATGVEAGAKTTSKFAKFFMKEEAEIAKIAKPNFWNKLNGKGKAGILGGAALVTYAIVAATGKKGQKQQEEMQRREAAAGQEVAVG